MIIIARKLGQTVKVGDVVIKIHEIKKSRVVLAIDAPPEVRVSRMNENRKVDRSELAIWAEGTKYTTDELATAYRDYLNTPRHLGDVMDEAQWCQSVLGIKDETPVESPSERD